MTIINSNIAIPVAVAQTQVNSADTTSVDALAQNADAATGAAPAGQSPSAPSLSSFCSPVVLVCNDPLPATPFVYISNDPVSTATDSPQQFTGGPNSSLYFVANQPDTSPASVITPPVEGAPNYPVAPLPANAAPEPTTQNPPVGSRGHANSNHAYANTSNLVAALLNTRPNTTTGAVAAASDNANGYNAQLKLLSELQTAFVSNQNRQAKQSALDAALLKIGDTTGSISTKAGKPLNIVT